MSERAYAPVLSAEELCDQYARSVHRFAVLIAKGDPEAEDIAQEALIKAIRAIPKFDPKRGSIEAWLWRIVVNTARDNGRAQVRRGLLWQRLGAEIDEESPDELAIMRHQTRSIIAAVRNLGRRDRTLIALRFGAGLDFRAIGAATSMEPGSARKAVQRALATLRQRLASQEALR